MKQLELSELELEAVLDSLVATDNEVLSQKLLKKVGKKPEKALYTFNWSGGGFNQVYATTKKEALAEVKKQFPDDGQEHGCTYKNVVNLKRVTAKQADAWYRMGNMMCN